MKTVQLQAHGYQYFMETSRSRATYPCRLAKTYRRWDSALLREVTANIREMICEQEMPEDLAEDYPWYLL